MSDKIAVLTFGKCEQSTKIATVRICVDVTIDVEIPSQFKTTEFNSSQFN